MNAITNLVNKNPSIWDIILLILRIWFGYVMMKNGFVFFKIVSSPAEQKVIQDWFGGQLHFPLPVFMACLAKGSEFFGGLLVALGLFTRVSALFVFITMLVATLVANTGIGWDVYGTITLSFALFALLFMYWGAGKYGLDAIFLKSKKAV
jgi:putative oxidoreductase